MRIRPTFCPAMMLLLVAVCSGCGTQNRYEPPPPPSVTVATPVRQTVTNYLEETGSTEPVQMVDIRARVSGYLEKINFQPGTDVEAGDTLYVIQQREYQAKADSARAEVQSMEVALNLAEIEYDRQLKLVADRATAQTNVDQTKAARDGAIAALDAAKAALDQALLNLEYTEVKTPISGRVGKTLVKLGNLVGETEATHLTTVVAYDPIYVNFNISERALLRVSQDRERAAGEPPDITTVRASMRRTLDEGFPFEGHLDYADLGVDQSTGTFLVRALFPNPNMDIFPGLFVRIRIPLGQLENAILIPERAIGADQAGRFVLIVGSDNVVERRNIETGGKYEDFVVITDGLNGDESVVIDGLQRSRPGSTVVARKTQLRPPQGELESFEQGPPAPPQDPAGIPSEQARHGSQSFDAPPSI